jgi:capsular polysaccharide biosynthesis protein
MRWQSIVIAGAAAAAIAVIVSAIVVVVAEPVYRASTDVSIRPRIADLGASESASRLIRNYAVWVDSEDYAMRLSAEVRGGLSDAEIVKRVRTDGDSDRLVVTIQAEDEDPDRAAAVVNGLADALVAEIATPARLNDPEKGLEIAVIDAARAPGAPTWPRGEVVIPVAAIVGAVVGAAVAWLITPTMPPARIEGGA